MGRQCMKTVPSHWVQAKISTSTIQMENSQPEPPSTVWWSEDIVGKELGPPQQLDFFPMLQSGVS
ncbi:UNVERIFIED_CONTAM: hypothetical protein Slati_4102900 [Sesamum latifolium]|uniref:Uncharacterized protein n=1 Tax=Sesamum latifolium TaxID=2727402 RepID=A0AAW2T7Q0_9LAMI